MGMLTDHIRSLDLEELDEIDAAERVTRRLVDHTAGAAGCTVTLIRTPSGRGSPEGRHVHTVDQIFIILAGTMSIAMGGEQAELQKGSIVVFPANEPHQNWNAGPKSTLHLSIVAPQPDPSVPFATRCGPPAEA
jgi:mannose-6-phosphate isomerase-like protein (cupin superfamily)